MVTIVKKPTALITYYGFTCQKCGCKFTANKEDIVIDTDISSYGVPISTYDIECPWCKRMGYYAREDITEFYRAEELHQPEEEKGNRHYYVMRDCDRILYNSYSTDLSLLEAMMYDNLFEEAYHKFCYQMMCIPHYKTDETEDEYAIRIAQKSWESSKRRYSSQVAITELKDIED